MHTESKIQVELHGSIFNQNVTISSQTINCTRMVAACWDTLQHNLCLQVFFRCSNWRQKWIHATIKVSFNNTIHQLVHELSIQKSLLNGDWNESNQIVWLNLAYLP